MVFDSSKERRHFGSLKPLPQYHLARPVYSVSLKYLLGNIPIQPSLSSSETTSGTELTIIPDGSIPLGQWVIVQTAISCSA